MNSALINQQSAAQYIAASQPSIMSTNINNFMACPNMQAQTQPFTNQQNQTIQNNMNQGFNIMPTNYLQQQVMSQNVQPNQCAVLCFPTYIGTNGYQGIPMYAFQNQQRINQNGMMQPMYPFMVQQQLIQNQNNNSSQQFIVNNQSNVNFNIPNPNTFQLNQPSQQKIINSEQMCEPSDQYQIDSLRIPSLFNIGNLQVNNTSGSFVFQNQETSFINAQQLSNNQIKIENLDNNKKCDNTYLQLSQSTNEDNNTFKLVKNHSISTTMIHPQGTHSSGGSLIDNDYEDVSSNLHTNYQFKTSSILTSKVDQGDAATAHSLSCPTDQLTTKQPLLRIPFKNYTKNQKKSKQSSKTKFNQNNIESSSTNSFTLKLQNKQQQDLLPIEISTTCYQKSDICDQSVISQQNKEIENNCTQTMNEEENSDNHNDYLSGDQNENMDNEEDNNEKSQQLEDGEAGKYNSRNGGRQGGQKKQSKQEQANQQNQQNKIIKETLLEQASSAEKELLNQIQQISKQNSAKAFLKAYKKFALQDQKYIYNYEINENQYYYKVCRDMPIIRIENPTKKDLEGFYRKFKKFFNGKQYNNNTLKIVVRNKLYGKLFNDFLELHSEKWLEESKSKNKDDLRIIIKFLEMCHQNLNYLVFLRDHDKSKDKSHSGYDSD